MSTTPPPAHPTDQDMRAAQERTGAEIAPGLTGAELDEVERDYGIRFAADHRLFLSVGLPTGGSWPDWRDGNARNLRTRLAWPVDGVLFDVENNAFWPADWGPRPAQLKHAIRSARYQLAKVPQLIPVYGHRYLPGVAGQWGHPVLSIMQTDVVCYGVDLVDWVAVEFGGATRRDAVSTVGFWSDLTG
ncbi:hypothetical protein [Streptomyces sp. SID3343]|uniref:hypothetical protein n=1 Tax=Streptomyces sp. SID3343 TaxID=2690260 RepID=UPI00192827D6|nr:hypothetical protein [Streptomyces sp. SID3343]